MCGSLFTFQAPLPYRHLYLSLLTETLAWRPGNISPLYKPFIIKCYRPNRAIMVARRLRQPITARNEIFQEKWGSPIQKDENM
jgi:hypothetical protein